MLYVVASPDLMTAAATNLAEIGSAISTANGAAALPTVEVVAAAADEVSTQIAARSERMPGATKPSAPRQRRFIVGLCRR